MSDWTMDLLFKPDVAMIIQRQPLYYEERSDDEEREAVELEQ